ncbi:MAG: AraC family transcriptional regulator [Monoglobaceae bacterium]
MKCFEIDLNHILKISLLGKEALIPPRMHYSRCIFEYVLYVVTSGSLELSINGATETLIRGDVYLFRAGDKQEPVKSSFCEYYYIHFRSDHVKETELSAEEYTNLLREKQELCFRADSFTTECYSFLNVTLMQKSHISDTAVFDSIIDTLQRNILTAECKLPEKRLAISNAVSTVLLKTESASMNETADRAHKLGKGYETVRNVASYIEQHCTEAISGEDIEKKFFLTFDYVNRIFRGIMGCTIIRYRNIARIQYAKAKIRATNQAIKEIAMDVGFENVHYFNRIFKKLEGLSPSEYKQKFKQNI